MQLQETKAISEAAYVEKERLNELVKLLEERYTKVLCTNTRIILDKVFKIVPSKIWKTAFKNFEGVWSAWSILKYFVIFKSERNTMKLLIID